MDIISQSLQAMLEQFLLFLPKLIVAVMVFFIGLYFSGGAARGVKRMAASRRLDPELSLLLERLARWTVIILSSVVALQQVNFDVTGFVAGLGIIGFALGFALQDVSKNFVAGILLLLQRPFDIGNVIEVSGYLGTVTEIDIRATGIRTLDGVPVLIPNGDVYVAAIKNFSRTKRRRLEVAVGVAYDSDLELVACTIVKALSGIAGVVADDPAPQVVFGEFGKSSIDLKAYFWIDLDKIDYSDAQDQAIKTIKTAFEQAGIEIPFPTHTLLMPQGSPRA